MDMEDDHRLDKMEEAQSQIVIEWRKKWLSQAFADMIPRVKWKTVERNVCVGDPGHIKYEQKLGNHTWRVARVAKVKLGPDGVVRTIVVKF